MLAAEPLHHDKHEVAIMRFSLLMSVSFLSTVLLLVLPGCSDSSDSRQETVTTEAGFRGQWQEHECKMTIPEDLTEENFRCGTFVVPANWDSPSEETRSFEVAVPFSYSLVGETRRGPGYQVV